MGVKQGRGGGILSELRLHKSVVQFLDIALPDSAVFLHIPMGERRDAVTGAKLKAMGAKAGSPDFMIFYMGNAYAVELKRDGGKLSPSQKDMRDRMLRAGVAWATVHRMTALERALREWGIPLKASVGA